MNKILRDEVEIGVAFSSAAKRQLEKLKASTENCVNPFEDAVPPSSTTNIDAVLVAENLAPAKRGKKTLRQNIKAIFRPIAQLLYRIVKPVLRSIAFRLRRYFTDGLRQDFIYEINRASAGTLREVQAARESLRQEILSASAGTLQEVEAARESLRQEILSASAGTLQEVQAARESLRQEILSVHTLAMDYLLSSISPRLERVEQFSIASARRVAVSCANNEVLVRTEVGYIVCSSSDNSTMAHLIENGEAEKGVRLLIQKILPLGGVFIDIGANLGLHTLAGARAVGPRGRVIAFEPFKETAEMLKKNIWMNGLLDRVEVQQKAVSNNTGFCKLFLGVGSAQHSLFQLSVPEGFEGVSVEVPMVRLDEYLDMYKKIDLLKIDAEGAELDILSGARSIISQNPEIGIIAEFGPAHLRRSGHSTIGWISEFQNLGLVYRLINTESGDVFTLSIDEMEKFDIINILFARPDASLWKVVDGV